jgi:hypothetical protein
MFLEDQEWTKDTVDFIKINSHMSLTQIYKWGWDQKKKVKNNPEGIMVPSIDEFGGYSKFEDNDESKKITKVLDIDWNEKIRLLDLDCENEEKRKLSCPEPKVYDYSNHGICDVQAPIDTKNSAKVDTFSTPHKTLKRERYSSDITNMTISGKNLSPAKKHETKYVNAYVTPFFEDEIEKDYSFENYNFENYDSFGAQSFILPNEKVSFPHLSLDFLSPKFSFALINLHNLGS